MGSETIVLDRTIEIDYSVVHYYTDFELISDWGMRDQLEESISNTSNPEIAWVEITAHKILIIMNTDFDWSVTGVDRIIRQAFQRLYKVQVDFRQAAASEYADV